MRFKCLVKTHGTDDTAEGMLYIDATGSQQAADILDDLLQAGNGLIRSENQWFSFAYSGSPLRGFQRSPVFSKNWGTLETYPTRTYTDAFLTAIDDGGKGSLAYFSKILNVKMVRFRMSWNDDDEQPERMA